MCVTDDIDEDTDPDPMDDPEAVDRSGKLLSYPLTSLFLFSCFVSILVVRIRSRLKKLMAKRPQMDQLKTKGIIEGKCFCVRLYMVQGI